MMKRLSRIRIAVPCQDKDRVLPRARAYPKDNRRPPRVVSLVRVSTADQAAGDRGGIHDNRFIMARLRYQNLDEAPAHSRGICDAKGVCPRNFLPFRFLLARPTASLSMASHGETQAPRETILAAR